MNHIEILNLVTLDLVTVGGNIIRAAAVMMSG